MKTFGYLLRRDVQRTGVVIKELDIPYNVGGFALSRDGNKLVQCKRKGEATNLFVHDLSSGEERQVTRHEAGSTAMPVFSPDGSKIAYALMQKGGSSLHAISLETGEDRRLDDQGFPSDWSKDGRYLALYSGSRWNQNTHSLLSIQGQNVEEVNLPLPAGKLQYNDMKFSPDGKYLAYERGGSLYLYAIDGARETQITEGSNEDADPVWAPDGKMLIFLSRRGYGPEKDLCTVPVVDGRSGGGVHVIKPDIGEKLYLRSLSDTGRLLYRQTNSEESIWLATVDPKTGQPTGEPKRLVDGIEGIWSPDGKRIAYLTNKRVVRLEGTVAPEVSLHVMSADGTNDQEIMKVAFPLDGYLCLGSRRYHLHSRGSGADHQPPGNLCVDQAEAACSARPGNARDK